MAGLAVDIPSHTLHPSLAHCHHPALPIGEQKDGILDGVFTSEILTIASDKILLVFRQVWLCLRLVTCLPAQAQSL